MSARAKATARGVAATVLTRVIDDEAFAAAALESELSSNVQLDARDRALSTELSYGTLRVLPWLERRLDRHSRKPVGELPTLVRMHLAVAAYQLFFMRVPAFAAVSEAVSSVRSAKGERMSAFANAVLRKLAADADAATDDDRQSARLASLPPELRASIVASIGEEGARALVGESKAPPACVRVERAAERGEWLARFRSERPDAEIEAGGVSPLAIVLAGAGKLDSLPGYREGRWSVQEEGSQAVALAVGAREGERVLDACAGRGNKTAILARAVGERGVVDACDWHPKKLERLRIELARVGLSARATFGVDWSKGSGDVTERYDRVLVDAPCSGTGTLRRRPEIAIREPRADAAALPGLQVAITARAAAHVRPGGRLIYAVCSVLRAEAEEVVGALAEREPSLEPAEFDTAELGPFVGQRNVRLLPHIHGTDGYFVASFVKRSG